MKFETECVNVEILENKPKMVISDVNQGSKLRCKVNMYHPDTVDGSLVVAVYNQRTLVSLTTYKADGEVLVDILKKDGDNAKIMWWKGLD